MSIEGRHLINYQLMTNKNPDLPLKAGGCYDLLLVFFVDRFLFGAPHIQSINNTCPEPAGFPSAVSTR